MTNKTELNELVAMGEAAEEGGADLGFDEDVHDAKSREGSEINNGSLRGQIEYLLNSGAMTAKEIRERIKEGGL